VVTLSLARVTTGRPWQDFARCAETDPEIFFPEGGQSTEPAKKVCRRCEVRGECLQDALAKGERFGVRGGLSERERRPLRRQYRKEVAA